MPTVTYRGAHKAGRNMGAMGFWRWGEPQEMSQEWVDTYAKGLVGNFHVDGTMFALTTTTTDAGKDGLPDMGWTKGDIMSWMDDKDIAYSVLNTKAKLLAKVDEYLNPPQDDSTEESMSEDTMDETTGDEE